jgi:pantoate--beta-alanine ligase
MAQVIKGEPAMTIDYLAICDPTTLEPLSTVTRKTVLLGAVRLGPIRLIDNILVAAKHAGRNFE